MATPTPEELQKQFEKLQRLATTLGKDLSKFNLGPLAQDASLVEEIIEKWNKELNDALSSVDDLASGFKSVVQEISKGNVGINATKKTFNSLTSLAQQLSYEQAGINKLSEKDLQNSLKKAKQAQKDAQISNDILNQRKQILINENRSNNIDLEQKKKNRAELNKINGALNDNQSIIDGTSQQYQDLLTNLNYRIAQEEKINKLMGLGGATVEGTQKALDKMGFGGLGKALGLDEVKKKMEETASRIEKLGDKVSSQKGKFMVLKSGISEAGKQLMTSLKDPLVITTFLVDEMVDALKKSDKETGELAKSFGTSYNEASNIRNELNTIANLSGDVNITTSALQKSLLAVNKEFGTATMFSGELLKDFTQLTEVAGYTNEAAARLSKISVATGTDLSKNTAQILGTAKAFNATNKLALNEKEIVEDVAKASKATTLSLGMQPEKLTKAVAQAKALGANLEKVEAISQSLLNFESSIASELEAELLIGKDLNLERARMYALNNDIAGVAKEIAGQIGKASDFTKMNVIQQEALAKSVGMTREDLAASLIEREALAKIGEGDKTAVEAYNRLKKEGLSDEQIRVKLGDDALANQLKSQSVQERFNASIEKLKEIFISLAGPVLQIVSPFMDLLNLVLPGLTVAFEVILTPIKLLAEGIGDFVNSLKTGEGILLNIAKILGGIALTYGIIKAIQLGITAQKIIQRGLDVTQATMSKGILATLVAQAVAWTIMNPFKALLGVALAGTVGAAIYSSMKDGIIDPKKGPVVSGEYGSVQLSEKDTAVFNGKEIIAGTNLGGKKSKSSSAPPIDYNQMAIALAKEINNRPVQVSVEMDGEKVAKGVGQNSTKLGNSMSTNTYQIQ
jgi:hypothetical protein